jgi:peroxin-3
MLDNFRRYLWDRRRGALKFAGVVGGLYLVTSYLLERLEEMREAVRQEKLAKEK